MDEGAVQAAEPLKRRSFATILAGALVLLSCELPIILALLGLGGMAATMETMRPPFWLEVVGVMAVAMGLMGLVWYVVSRRRKFS